VALRSITQARLSSGSGTSRATKAHLPDEPSADVEGLPTGEKRPANHRVKRLIVGLGAGEAGDRSCRHVGHLTPEIRPLAIFGERATVAVSERLEAGTAGLRPLPSSASAPRLSPPEVVNAALGGLKRLGGILRRGQGTDRRGTSGELVATGLDPIDHGR
jgi:hypothetical protein